MPNLRIILIEPKEAGNVGATARVMKNFGFRELWIVGEHPPLQPSAGWWASGADDVVTSARFAPTLHAAIADTQLAIATTSARGRTTPVDLSPSDLSETFAALGESETLALVFGSWAGSARLFGWGISCTIWCLWIAWRASFIVR